MIPSPRQIRRQRLFVAWTVTVFSVGLLLVPLPEEVRLLAHAPYDKVVHAGLMGVLSFSWLRARIGMAAVLIIGVSLGLLIELLQPYVSPSRAENPMDAAANVAGVVAGVFWYTRWASSVLQRHTRRRGRSAHASLSPLSSPRAGGTVGSSKSSGITGARRKLR